MYTLEQVMAMLIKAAEKGLEVGKAGTEGDHTAAGIAMTVYLDNKPPAVPTKPQYRHPGDL